MGTGAECPQLSFEMPHIISHASHGSINLMEVEPIRNPTREVQSDILNFRQRLLAIITAPGVDMAQTGTEVLMAQGQIRAVLRPRQ
jgi:hypothetical protein